MLEGVNKMNLDFLALSKALPELHALLFRGSETYSLIENISQDLADRIFGPHGEQSCELLPAVKIQLPYHQMGAINSTHLFGLDELILFAFYSKQLGRLEKVADVGANIGLHSIVLSKLGFEVRAFEPDPSHVEILRANLEINGVSSVEVNEKAVSRNKGTVEFVRVLGNTTGSHIAGAKDSYGEKEAFRVETESFGDLMNWAELIKLDVEGHEAEILSNTLASDWESVDALVEVGSIQNAEVIFNHFKNLGIKLFGQKVGWKEIRTVEEMPKSHREGSVFISKKDYMPW